MSWRASHTIRSFARPGQAGLSLRSPGRRQGRARDWPWAGAWSSVLARP